MTYVKRTSLSHMSAKRPGELLQTLLKQRGVTTTQFGEMMGGDYQLARRWIRGEGFDNNPRNQARAAKALGVPPNFFRTPDVAEQRERLRRRAFEKFCTTELGQSMSVEEYATLDSIRIFVAVTPTVAYYQIQLGLLRNNLPQSIADEATRMNDRADAEIAKAERERGTAEDRRDVPPATAFGPESARKPRVRDGVKHDKDQVAQNRARKKSPSK